tara:strand:+ start:621 stop:1202 length:582 start_codon:yes stop_codon:yes gene_type:complete
MDEIFLQDYANNVAQAQDPYGLASVQAQPGFENYTPSNANQSLTPMGLSEPQGTPLPDFKEMAKTVAINQAKDYAIKKIGLEGIKGNVLNSVIGASSFTNPIGALYTVGSVLPDGVRGIAEVLRNKRAQKAIQRDIKRDSQGDIKTVNLQNAGNPNPYSGGSGGVQSGMASQGQKDAGPGFSGSGSAAEMGSF